MSKKYYEKVDILRGFAMFLMILGHAVAVDNIGGNQVTWCDGVFRYIYSFHMPLFFAISGFCLFETGNYLQLIKKKARYILLPYVVFNFVAMALRMLIPQFSLGSKSVKDSLISMLTEGGELWFLYVLFELFLIAPVLIRLIDNRWSRFVIAELVLFAAYLALHEITVFKISQVLFYMMFFLAGNMIQKKNIAIGVKAWVLPLLVVAQIALLIANYRINFIWANLVLQLILAVIGCIAAYLFIGFIRWGKAKTAFKNWGQYSLQLYLFNGYFIAVSRTVFLGILNLPIPVVVLCNFIFGLFLNYIWCYYILKIRFVRILCGKK